MSQNNKSSSILGTALDLRHTFVGKTVAFNCTLPENMTEPGWYCHDDLCDPLLTTPPKCVNICEENPPMNGDYYNITWIQGSISEGATATYTCSGARICSFYYEQVLKLPQQKRSFIYAA